MNLIFIVACDLNCCNLLRVPTGVENRRLRRLGKSWNFIGCLGTVTPVGVLCISVLICLKEHNWRKVEKSKKNWNSCRKWSGEWAHISQNGNWKESLWGRRSQLPKNSYHLSCLRLSGSILHIRGKSKGILLYKTEWELCQILYLLAGCVCWWSSCVYHGVLSAWWIVAASVMCVCVILMWTTVANLHQWMVSMWSEIQLK